MITTVGSTDFIAEIPAEISWARAIGVTDISFRPNHPVIDLISHLHHIRLYPDPSIPALLFLCNRRVLFSIL